MASRWTTPWKSCRSEVQNIILHGTGEEPSQVHLRRRPRLRDTKPFEGVIGNLERRWRETDSAWMREELERYQTAQPCEPATATA
jgi:excinuclease ABC subunit A